MVPNRMHDPTYRIDKIALTMYVAASLAGLQALLGGPISPSSSLQLPHTLILWQAGLFLAGGVFAIIGRFRHSTQIGFSIEFAGNLFLCTSAAAFVITVWALLGFIVTTPVQIMGALAIGTGWRLLDILSNLKWMRRGYPTSELRGRKL